MDVRRRNGREGGDRGRVGGGGGRGGESNKRRKKGRASQQCLKAEGRESPSSPYVTPSSNSLEHHPFPPPPPSAPPSLIPSRHSSCMSLLWYSLPFLFSRCFLFSFPFFALSICIYPSSSFLYFPYFFILFSFDISFVFPSHPPFSQFLFSHFLYFLHLARLFPFLSVILFIIICLSLLPYLSHLSPSIP